MHMQLDSGSVFGESHVRVFLVPAFGSVYPHGEVDAPIDGLPSGAIALVLDRSPSCAYRRSTAQSGARESSQCFLHRRPTRWSDKSRTWCRSRVQAGVLSHLFTVCGRRGW